LKNLCQLDRKLCWLLALEPSSRRMLGLEPDVFPQLCSGGRG